MVDAGAAAAGPSKVVKVRREVLSGFMTCPLCCKLLRDATTIPECLHTFCRKCITKKLNDEETDHCPVCNIGLGVVPMEKLRSNASWLVSRLNFSCRYFARFSSSIWSYTLNETASKLPDHNLQDIRAKIFPSKQSKVEAPEEIPTPILPVKRKEKSLSSLVVSTSHVVTRTCSSGRQTKTASKRVVTARGLSSSTDASSEKDDNTVNNYVEKSSSNEKMSKALKRKQAHSNVEPSNHMFQDNADIWDPLNCLVEAANRTKAFSSVTQRHVVKEENFNGCDGEVNIKNERVKVHQHKSKILEQADNILLQPVTLKESRLQRVKRRSKDLTASSQSFLDAQNSQFSRKINPIWFSLVPSTDQTIDQPFPHLSSNYLRIK
ncbi:hypothetical protein ZIOFF_004104 [Zingiber officinale]|uniref:RING-type domain-containing protein n=1 Tax=Zingiber officinale TaxID=94328 RepID=A0A8J5MAM3_ZINOF|nr:hypothetical protein ZIOFF_004104 [Zingiber officinale]